MAWWRRTKVGTEPEAASSTGFPLIRLEGITKIFKGDADEETRALSDVTRRHRPRRVHLGLGSVGLRQVDVPLDSGAARHADVRALLAERPARRSAVARRTRAGPQPRHRADLSELQPDRRHDGVRERRVPADAAAATPPSARRRVEAALERVGLTPRAKQRPGSLSGGHQQLVAIARAIAGRPPILLADEPTGNLDSKSGEALMQMLGELHADGATVCLATHDPHYIARAQRHIYLFDGRVVDHPVA